MSLLQLQAQDAETLSPAKLVEQVVLPAVDGRQDLGPGVVVLVVEGERGGAWTCDLDRGELLVGDHRDPDCTVRLTEAAFAELIRGRLDATSALEAGELRCSGDPTKLEALALAIRPPSPSMKGASMKGASMKGASMKGDDR